MAFLKHIQNHKAAKEEAFDFTHVDPHRRAEPWNMQMYRRDRGMTVFPLRERRSIDATTCGPSNFGFNLLEHLRDDSNRVLQVQFTTRECEECFISSSMALIVSRLSIKGPETRSWERTIAPLESVVASTSHPPIYQKTEDDLFPLCDSSYHFRTLSSLACLPRRRFCDQTWNVLYCNSGLRNYSQGFIE